MRKCYNIDDNTESFFWNLGPLSYFGRTFTSRGGCGWGVCYACWYVSCPLSCFQMLLSMHRVKALLEVFIVRTGYDQSGCHSASALFKYGEGEKRIRWVMMH